MADAGVSLDLRSICEGADGEAASLLQHCLEVTWGPSVVDGGVLREGIEERASEGAASGHDADTVHEMDHACFTHTQPNPVCAT